MDPLFFNPVTSFTDHPDKISLVVYTKKCNFSCFGCHNMRSLLASTNSITTESIIKKLQRNDSMIDLLIICGGEPLLLGDTLVQELKKIKEATSTPIRIDTNGTNPDMVELLKAEQLVDGFAMDIKFPYWMGRLPLLKNITGIENVPLQKIMQSMSLIDGMPYSLFRTVKYPILPKELIENIVEYMKPFKSPHYVNPYYHFA